MSHLILAFAAVLFVGFGLANTEDCDDNASKDWYYDKNLPNGPDKWSDKYDDCKGVNQSPIDIPTAKAVPIKDSDGLNVKNYDEPLSQVKIKNIGHTMKLEPNDDIERVIVFNDVSYKLTKIYFTWGDKQTNDDNEVTITPGSNHMIDGKQYAMEISLEHETDESDQKVVIAVLLDNTDDTPNPALGAVLNPIDKYKYEDMEYDGNLDDDYSTKIDLSNLVPYGSSFYQYNGSLPVPPCTENVMWFVLQNPSTVATDQILKCISLYSVKKSDDDTEDKKSDDDADDKTGDDDADGKKGDESADGGKNDDDADGEKGDDDAGEKSDGDSNDKGDGDSDDKKGDDDSDDDACHIVNNFRDPQPLNDRSITSG